MRPKAHNWPSTIVAIAMLTWAILTCSGTVSFADDPIKTLIVDGSNNHDCGATTPVITEMMEASGRFTVDVSTCPQNPSQMGEYKPDFAKYDLVVVNNGNNANNWVRETEVAFEEFVAAGGGVVIYHAADNAWPDWKAYNEMIGIGGWGRRDHTAGPYIYMDKEGNVIRDVSKGKTGGHGSQESFLITVRRARTSNHEGNAQGLHARHQGGGRRDVCLSARSRQEHDHPGYSPFRKDEPGKRP